MSHRIEPQDLWNAAKRQQQPAAPFLSYTKGEGVKITHVVVESSSRPEVLRCSGFGRSLVSDLRPDLSLTLLWPASTEDGFSLLADGYGQMIGEGLVITVESAVLHRPAPIDGEPTCG